MPVSLRIAATFAAVAISCAAQAAPRYTYVDIGRTNFVTQINAEGDVLGVPDGLPAIYTSSTGQWRIIASKPSYAAEALNNRDEAVGERNFGSRGRPHAVVFKPSGKIADLLRSRESYAKVLRSDGTAYGVARPFDGGATFPFIWRGGRVTSLDSFAGFAWTMPVGATKSGEIAANAENDPRSPICPIQPLLYSGGAWNSLGSLGGTCGMATAMNDHGDIVGWSDYAGDNGGAGFLWHDGVMTDIGTLAGQIAEPHDVNVLGQVVGVDIDHSGNGWAFIYVGGVMTWLDDLVDNPPPGTTFTDAVSINETGQILVYGTTPTSIDTFILTPVQ